MYLKLDLNVVDSSGSYGVILDERHYRELLMQHVTPPVAKACTGLPITATDSVVISLSAFDF